jgi:hypothetical protein
MSLLHVSAHQERHPQGAQCNPHEIVCMLCHEQTVSTLCFQLFHIHDIAYIQFHEDYVGLPEDGAPDAPKHAGAR